MGFHFLDLLNRRDQAGLRSSAEKRPLIPAQVFSIPGRKAISRFFGGGGGGGGVEHFCVCVRVGGCVCMCITAIYNRISIIVTF